MIFLKGKNTDYILALLAYVGIAVIILSQILISPGTVGFFHDWFIGPYHEMNKNFASSGLYKWDTQVGNKNYDTDWIFRLILLSFPVLDGEILSKGLLIITITLSGFGAHILARTLRLSNYVCFAAGMLYIFTPIIFTRIVAGHIYYLIGYFLTPIIIASFIKGKDENNRRYFIIAGLLLSLAIIQIQYLVMIFIILAVLSLTDIKRVKKSVVGLMIISTVTFFITFPPIILPLLVSDSGGMQLNINQLLNYHALIGASDFTKSFRILGYEIQPYSYLNLGTSLDLFPSNAGIIPKWIFYLDFVIPIVGFSVLLFRRDKYTLSFALISILGLYLMKGLNPIFSGLFAYLFLHGFYIFREIWHIAFLYCFSVTFLSAFFISNLSQIKLKPVLKACAIFGMISTIIVSNGYPLLLGNFAGYVQTYKLPSNYHNLYTEINNDRSYNILILPYVNPIRYDGLKLPGIDPFIVDTPGMIFPTFLINRATPVTGVSTWLLSTMQENMTETLGNTLSGFGIKYVILRKDFMSNYPSYTPQYSLLKFREKWYSPLEPILDNQKDLKIIANNPNFKIYQNLVDANKIFVSIASGGRLTNFDSLLLISNFTSLANLALYPNQSTLDSLIFFDDKRESNMSTTDFVSVGRYAQTFDASTGWTDNLDSFGYDRTLATRVNQGLFTESKNSQVSFELPSKYENAKVEVWVKALLWKQGGKIEVQVDGKKSPISLFSQSKSFELFKLFETERRGDEPFHISIKNFNGKNYIEGFYIIDKNFQRPSLKDKIILPDFINGSLLNPLTHSLLSSENDSMKNVQIGFNNSEFNNLMLLMNNDSKAVSDLSIPEITDYRNPNPTVWSFNINTSRPVTIGFAEAYDDSWQATIYKSGKKIEAINSMPLYGAINGFHISNIGNLEIVLSYTPQYWYEIGLLISLVSFAFCILYIVFDWRKSKVRI